MAEKENKPVEVKGVSPRGVFKYPHLIEPDYGTDEHPIEEGEYNVWLVVDQDVADKFLAKLQPAIDSALEIGEEGFAKLKPAQRKKLGELTVNEVGQPIYDPETEEPTGKYEFRFKTKASGVTPKGKAWTRKMTIFDASRTPIKKCEAIWGGSEGKLSYVARPYFIAGQGMCGVSLYLEAVQLLELVAAGQRTAEGYGFDDEEGYTAEEAGSEFDDSDDYDTAEADTGDDEGDSEDF